MRIRTHIRMFDKCMHVRIVFLFITTLADTSTNLLLEFHICSAAQHLSHIQTTFTFVEGKARQVAFFYLTRYVILEYRFHRVSL